MHFCKQEKVFLEKADDEGGTRGNDSKVRKQCLTWNIFFWLQSILHNNGNLFLDMAKLGIQEEGSHFFNPLVKGRFEVRLSRAQLCPCVHVVIPFLLLLFKGHRDLDLEHNWIGPAAEEHEACTQHSGVVYKRFQV